jgi:uncharacterized protein
MSLSLRDQLLKAGLVTEQQVQRVERDQRQTQFAAPRNKRKPAGPTPQELAAQKAAAEKAAKDSELNRRKQEKAQRRAKFAEIKQLVATHQVPRVETEDFYNFQEGPSIHRIAVTPELRRQLIAGQLAIVRSEGRYAFVPADVGEKIGERVARALVHIAKPEAKPADDDPYRNHVIPDDLMW